MESLGFVLDLCGITSDSKFVSEVEVGVCIVSLAAELGEIDVSR